MHDLTENVEVMTPISYTTILAVTAIHKTWNNVCLALAIREQSINTNKKAMFLATSSGNTESASFWLGIFLI